MVALVYVPRAYQPRPCRTYRVPCAASQVIGGLVRVELQGTEQLRATLTTRPRVGVGSRCDSEPKPDPDPEPKPEPEPEPELEPELEPEPEPEPEHEPVPH